MNAMAFIPLNMANLFRTKLLIILAITKPYICIEQVLPNPIIILLINAINYFARNPCLVILSATRSAIWFTALSTFLGFSISVVQV